MITSDHETMDVLLGNRYKIEDQLSQKSGRTTFLAEDTHNHEKVIIKILRFNDSFQWDDLKLFEREANTLKNITHPAIPRYLDYFEVDEEDVRGFALVQTYIDAPSLQTVIKEGRTFTEAELVEFAEKMLDILDYLHQQKPPIIHRDIKPSNILITNRSGNSIGEVYLVDFGSVQTVARKEEGTITIVGSYGYMPLEQFTGQTTIASDLYSLGMTIIYAITGSHPSQLTQSNGLVQFDSHNISNRFALWLKKMTYPYLDRRFQSAQLARQALKTYNNSLQKKIGFYMDKSLKKRAIVNRSPDALEIIYPDAQKINIGCGTAIVLLMISSLFAPILPYLPKLVFMAFLGFKFYELIDPSISTRKLERILSIELGGYIGQGIIENSGKVRWQNPTSSTQEINFLTFSAGYQSNRYQRDSHGRFFVGKELNIPPSLSIYANDTEYRIDSQILCQAELWELGEELSDFLEIDLKIVQPSAHKSIEPGSPYLE